MAMDLAWDDPRMRKFVTNIGLITSTGPYGPNIMAAEWTHHISYAPSLILVSISPNDATAENIRATKEFGVNLAAVDQANIASIAGGSTGKEVNKIAVLKELGVEVYPAKHIKAPMVKGAALNAECKLLETVPRGDHILFIGEVLDISVEEKLPLIYHDGKYWHLGERIPKPPQEVLDNIKTFVTKYHKQ